MTNYNENHTCNVLLDEVKHISIMMNMNMLMFRNFQDNSGYCKELVVNITYITSFQHHSTEFHVSCQNF